MLSSAPVIWQDTVGAVLCPQTSVQQVMSSTVSFSESRCCKEVARGEVEADSSNFLKFILATADETSIWKGALDCTQTKTQKRFH